MHIVEVPTEPQKNVPRVVIEALKMRSPPGRIV